MNESDVNIVLFSREELARPLPLADRRARHIIEVLRRRPADEFDAGVLNGERGKARIDTIGEDAIRFTFTATHARQRPDPLALIIGLPRPQTARDMLRDATTLGVESMDFVLTEKSDANYAQSTLWQGGEWRRHAVAGAEQAFDPNLPDIRFGETLRSTLAARNFSSTSCVALDNYAGGERLAIRALRQLQDRVALAIGPERGWSDVDRALLREGGFEFVHLGPRVLRAETALVAALSIVKSARGSL